jgi:hypothetical protein
MVRHRKAMVSPLDRDELRAVFRLRQQIEPDLAAWSVSMLRDGDLERANTLLTAYIHGLADIGELWESHHELHLALLRPAASQWDLRILGPFGVAGRGPSRPGWTWPPGPATSTRCVSTRLCMAHESSSAGPLSSRAGEEIVQHQPQPFRRFLVRKTARAYGAGKITARNTA